MVYDYFVGHVGYTFLPQSLWDYRNTDMPDPYQVNQVAAARIRQAAASCDFANIENPLDKA